MKKIIFILSLSVMTANAQSVCFDAPSSLNSPTVSAFNALISSDFNGDGKKDLATLDGNLNKLSILFGLGTGKFATAITYTLIPNPIDMISGDFNGDGNPDLAVSAGNYISVLLGSATGTFSNTVNYVTSSPGTITCGDFNGDGIADLATHDLTQLYVRLGTGAGTFGTAATYTIGAGVTGKISSSDFNGDGKDDIVAISNSLNKISILMASGSGAFPAATQYNVGSPQSITCGDFNNDGNKDLAVTVNLSSTTGSVCVLIGSGAGAFGAPVYYSVGMNPDAITSTDFNGDNNIDLAVVNVGSKNVSVLFGNSTGTFTSSIGYCVGVGSAKIVSADFDNDGNKDIITSNSGSYDLSILPGSGNGSFLGIRNYNSIGYAESVISGDFNHDGNFDLVESSINGIAVLFGLGTGLFAPPVNYYYNNLAYVTSADFNGDGNLDLAVGTNGGNYIRILLGSTSGTFAAAVSYTAGNNPFGLTCADFNMDGKTDIATANNGSNTISILLGTGTGSFGSAVSYTVGTNPIAITTGDYNNDTNPDIAVSTSSNGLIVLAGTGTGNFTPLYNNVQGGQVCLATGDYNSDGNADLAMSSNGVGVLLGTGSGNFYIPSTFNYFNANTNARTFTSADFNGDGILDIMTSNYATHNSSLLIGSGLGTFVETVDYWVCKNPCSITSADFNGDGKPDFAAVGSLIPLFDMAVFINKGLPYTAITSSNIICAGTSITLDAAGTNAYVWNTGSTTASITVTPTTSTIYTVTATDINNCSSTQTVNVIVNQACQDVWPGDANSDGTANNFDVLELGLHYTQFGPARSSISNLWQGFTVLPNWSGIITNGMNLNNSDCNGDGIINDNDTLAIYINYGLTHPKENAQSLSNPQLGIVSDQTIVTAGTWGTSSVYLGDASTTISSINGIAFTVNFDETLIEPNSFYIEYPTSFLNTSNQNLKFSKPDFNTGIIYTATTHTNNINVTGNGKIAILHYKMSSLLTTDAVLNISLVQAKQSNASGVLITLTAGSATVAAIGASVGLDELQAGNTFGIFPNPASNYVIIQSTALLQKAEIVSVTGQIVLSEPATGNQHQFDVSSLANGVYFVTVTTSDHQIQRKKIVVQR